MYNGIININKEAGYTSFDVVAILRGIFGQRKIGHTGTLDPQATGVLPVCLGTAAKICDMLMDKDKEYVAELLLGVTTDTQDITGRILDEKEQALAALEPERIKEIIMGFVGEYDQIPPMYSALKVDGKKLCDLARKGIEVERKPRRVTIKEIEILSFELPVVRLRVVCSRGTYIRTLCQDIGEQAGCGGCMKSLVRTRVERFRLEDALTISQVQELKDQKRLSEAVIGVDTVFSDCPALHVKPEWRKLVDNGNEFHAQNTEENMIYAPGEWIRVYLEEEFAGIYAWHTEAKCYRPVKIFRQI